MRIKIFLILTVIFFGVPLQGHGFGGQTLVNLSGQWCTISQISRNISAREQKVLSYDPVLASSVVQKISFAGQSEVDYYLRLGFEEGFNDDVLCSPTQEFYMPVTKRWVPAYKLEIGDLLLKEGNKVVPITYVERVTKPLKVYSIEVNKNHNFFVGRYSILTHNMVLPIALTVSFGFSFGAGATAGGTAGSFFGPMVWAGGCVIGGLVGIAAKAIMMNDESIPKYRLDLNPEIVRHWHNDVQKPISNDWNHIFIKNGYKHGFVGGPNDEEPEKWWEKMVRILERAYKDGEIKDNGYSFEISRPQSVNPNFGDLTIRGKIVQGIIKIGTAFLRNVI